MIAMLCIGGFILLFFVFVAGAMTGENDMRKQLAPHIASLESTRDLAQSECVKAMNERNAAQQEVAELKRRLDAGFAALYPD